VIADRQSIPGADDQEVIFRIDEFGHPTCSRQHVLPTKPVSRNALRSFLAG
jgi:hypothetical protein